SSHPVILVGRGDVLHDLAPITTVELRAAGTGGTDVGDGEARVIGHRHDGGLAVALMAFESDLLRVHSLVGLEIIQRTTRAPSPRAQRAPVLRLTGPALVAEADDALRKTRTSVLLHAVRADDGVAPTLRENLLLPGRAGVGPAESRARETIGRAQ